jgi:2-oxoisovalerate dehydrogenase E1 component beta subunit
VLTEGSDITLIGYGNLMRTLVSVASKLKEEGISAEVIDLQTIYPYDAETLIKSVKKTGRCLITHEAPKTVGVGAEISAKIQEECFLHLKSPIARVCGYDTPFPLVQEPLYLPTEWKIYEAVHKSLKY